LRCKTDYPPTADHRSSFAISYLYVYLCRYIIPHAELTRGGAGGWGLRYTIYILLYAARHVAENPTLLLLCLVTRSNRTFFFRSCVVLWAVRRVYIITCVIHIFKNNNNNNNNENVLFFLSKTDILFLSNCDDGCTIVRYDNCAWWISEARAAFGVGSDGGGEE